MGFLFEDREKKEDIENAVMRVLSQAPILDDIIARIDVEQEEKTWLTKGQSYYDSCTRVVIIEPDLFMIQWIEAEEQEYVDKTGKRQTRMEDVVIEEIKYRYTARGYVPLHEHRNGKDRIDVPVLRVCSLWAALIRERMAAKMKSCEFWRVMESTDGKPRAKFTYKVPALSFRDWF